MNCHKCGQLNKDENTFCAGCGQKLSNTGQPDNHISTAAEINCPSCKGLISISQEYFGQDIECPLCKEVFKASRSSYPQPKQKSNKTTLFVVLGALGVIVLLCVITGLVAMLKVSNMTPQQRSELEKKVQERREQRQVESDNSEILGIAEDVAPQRDIDNTEVIGDSVIYTMKTDRLDRETLAWMLLNSTYEISCKAPTIKYVKIRLIYPDYKTSDKYGNETKQDIEVCTVSAQTDPQEASKYKNYGCWTLRGGSVDDSREKEYVRNVCSSYPQFCKYYKSTSAEDDKWLQENYIDKYKLKEKYPNSSLK